MVPLSTHTVHRGMCFSLSGSLTGSHLYEEYKSEQTGLFVQITRVPLKVLSVLFVLTVLNEGIVCVVG